ncbi:MAG: IreB family regulatory phosphoprotein [Bacillota bacterium]
MDKQLVDAGESADRVAGLAGDAGLNTTARHTKLSFTDLERAVAWEWPVLLVAFRRALDREVQNGVFWCLGEAGFGKWGRQSTKARRITGPVFERWSRAFMRPSGIEVFTIRCARLRATSFSGEPAYITGFRGARELIQSVERYEIVGELLRAYFVDAGEGPAEPGDAG